VRRNAWDASRRWPRNYSAASLWRDAAAPDGGACGSRWAAGAWHLRRIQRRCFLQPAWWAVVAVGSLPPDSRAPDNLCHSTPEESANSTAQSRHKPGAQASCLHHHRGSCRLEAYAPSDVALYCQASRLTHRTGKTTPVGSSGSMATRSGGGAALAPGYRRAALQPASPSSEGCNRCRGFCYAPRGVSAHRYHRVRRVAAAPGLPAGKADLGHGTGRCTRSNSFLLLPSSVMSALGLSQLPRPAIVPRRPIPSPRRQPLNPVARLRVFAQVAAQFSLAGQ